MLWYVFVIYMHTYTYIWIMEGCHLCLSCSFLVYTFHWRYLLPRRRSSLLQFSSYCSEYATLGWRLLCHHCSKGAKEVPTCLVSHWCSVCCYSSRRMANLGTFNLAFNRSTPPWCNKIAPWHCPLQCLVLVKEIKLLVHHTSPFGALFSSTSSLYLSYWN